ncbi:glycosyltransferase [Prosthecomicrobium pneumaticum]|uniref:Glycosyltransferase involved in cell wall biosynthesis n=1 Tax=Prosthecomicrobium pneumaticum TaxID=81895 RepID=A0A7W9FQJ5_9HYPH|nr:glycosyltransferase [Prosthecomicrobium pneumaticum]MBB5755020.1 glycosyltransferase involved in cell wall biosynthesis [Prosthecomicrobium pneumaticum]
MLIEIGGSHATKDERAELARSIGDIAQGQHDRDGTGPDAERAVGATEQEVGTLEPTHPLRRLVSADGARLAIRAAFRHPLNHAKRRNYRNKHRMKRPISGEDDAAPSPPSSPAATAFAAAPGPGSGLDPAAEHLVVPDPAPPAEPPLRSGPLFDEDWYRATNPDLQNAGLDPYLHFMEHGWKEGRNPSPHFDVNWYLDTYNDVKSANVNPLEHYIQFGWKELRDPSPAFSVRHYLEYNPDVAASGMEPCGHYITHGRKEGLIAWRSANSGDRYEAYLQATRWNLRQETSLRRRLETAQAQLPFISVLIPVYNTPAPFLIRAIESLYSQLYQNFEICISDDASTDGSVHDILRSYGARDRRIKTHYRRDNGHISRNTNDAFALSAGEVIVLLDADDELSWDALAEIALAFATDEAVDYVYSDSDKMHENGQRFDPHFKPDWSPELLLTYMYAGQCLSVRRGIWEALGGLRVGYEGSQDHDFALRATEIARKVHHIPRILYHWRSHAGSTASPTEGGAQKSYSFEAGRKAVQDALGRRGSAGVAIRPDFAVRGGNAFYHIDFPDDGPRVSILIPTHASLSVLRNCVASLKKTTYRNYEVVIVGDGWIREEVEAELGALGARVIWWDPQDKTFSFSRKMNWAAAQVDSPFILLLNDDTEVINPRWLSSMVGYALLPGVGPVGALLRYADGRVQHAGVLSGLEGGACDHAFKLARPDDLGYCSLIAAARNCSAVTAACMLVARSLYLRFDGLDEKNFAVAFNDPDFCFRLQDGGFRSVYTPNAELIHHEGFTRGFGDDPDEVAAYLARHGERQDPYFNPGFTRAGVAFKSIPTVVAPPSAEPLIVGFVSHNMNWEGASRHLYNLVIEFSRSAAIKPVVFSLAGGPLATALASHGIMVRILPPLPGWNCTREIYQGWLRLVEAEFSARRLSTVFANTLHCFFAVDAARNIGLGSIWNIHEGEGESYFADWSDTLKDVVRSCFSKVYRLVFVAHATARTYATLDRNNVTMTIKNGYVAPGGTQLSRAEARARLGIDDDALVFLSVGTVCARKSQLDIISALYGFSDDEVAALPFRIYIVGDRPGPYSEALAAAVAALPAPLRERVVVVGETGDVAPYFTAADVFVCASRMESYPTVILEAMGAGLAIVTTPVFGIVEQVREGKNAVFFEPGDTATLHGHLSDLVGNREKVSHMRAYSRRQLRSLPSYEYMVRAYRKIISESSYASPFT